MTIILWIVRYINAGLCFLAFLSLQAPKTIQGLARFLESQAPILNIYLLGNNLNIFIVTGVIAFTISLITKQA